MKSIKSALLLLPLAALFLAACSPIDTPEITSDRDEDSAGARLYALHCSACHGNYGRGGVGVPLALSDFLESVDNRYIALTIRFGRPGRVMPAFPRLSGDEVLAITEYIRSFHWADEPVFPSTPVHGDPQSGARLFATYCARCHGANGEGGEGTGVSFSRPEFIPILAPALNNAGYLAAASDQIIKRSLTLGREQTPMRSVLSMGLGEQQINDLVSYIRSFQQQSVTQAAIRQTAEAALIWPSPYNYDETIERVRQAIAGNGYRVVREQMLGEGILTPDVGERHQHVIYFASLRMITDGLAHDPRMGLFLPGRIIIIEQEDGIKVLASNPRQYPALFNNKALNSFAETLYQTYQTILGEATS